MEVAWRGAADELRTRGPVFAEMMQKKKKKQSWGVDAHKVVQLMMGQLQQSSSVCENTARTSSVSLLLAPGDDDVEVTLDLLGSSAAAHGEEAAAAAAASCPSYDDSDNMVHGGTASTEFLELDPDQPRLPADWKKCLDLKTGKMSFVNNTTGVTLNDDPRKQPLDVAPLVALEPPPSSHSPRAHEFLRSKQSEILLREEISLKTSSSTSASGGSPRHAGAKRDSCNLQMLSSFSAGKQLWNLPLEDTTNVSLQLKDTLLAAEQQQERSKLELDLNLAAGAPAGPPSPQQQEQSVCTMAMVQRALRRTDQQGQASGAYNHRKRELRIAVLPCKPSASPSFSSLTSARSEPTWSLGSPSTSSSSAISSRSPRLDANQAPVLQDDAQTSKTVQQCTSAIGDAESSRKSTPAAAAAAGSSETASALVMGACTRCLMYVMLDKSHPKCPRCSSDALVDFAPTPPTFTTTVSCCIKRQRVEA